MRCWLVAVLAVVALNFGGPDSLAAVQPFLRNLFADPDVIQLGWARPLQPLLARLIARRRAAFSRAAYAQIGGRSPIRDESTAQVQAVVRAMGAAGVAALRGETSAHLLVCRPDSSQR